MPKSKLDQAVELSCWVVDHLDELTPEQIREYKEKVLELKRQHEQESSLRWYRPVPSE